jgi:hypothetical protein
MSDFMVDKWYCTALHKYLPLIMSITLLVTDLGEL